MSKQFLTQNEALLKIGGTAWATNKFATKEWLMGITDFDTSYLTGYQSGQFVVDNDIVEKPVAHYRTITLTPIIYFYNNGGKPLNKRIGGFYMAYSVKIGQDVENEWFNNGHTAGMAWESSYQSTVLHYYAAAGEYMETAIGQDNTLSPVQINGSTSASLTYQTDDYIDQIRSAIFYFGISSNPYEGYNMGDPFKVFGNTATNISDIGRYPIEFGIGGWWGSYVWITDQLNSAGINNDPESSWSGSFSINLAFSL